MIRRILTAISALFRPRRAIVITRAAHKAQRQADRKTDDLHLQLAREIGRKEFMGTQL